MEREKEMNADIKCDKIIKFSELFENNPDNYHNTLIKIQKEIKKSAIIVGILEDQENKQIILWGHKIYETFKNREWRKLFGDPLFQVPTLGIRLKGDELRPVFDALLLQRGVRGRVEDKQEQDVEYEAMEEFWHWYYVTEAKGVEKIYEALHFAWISCFARLEEHHKKVTLPPEERNKLLNCEVEDPAHPFIGLIAIEGVLKFLRSEFPELDGYYDHTDFDINGESAYIPNDITERLDEIRNELRSTKWDLLHEAMDNITRLKAMDIKSRKEKNKRI